MGIIDFILWAAVAACLVALIALAVHYKALERMDAERQTEERKRVYK